jgi:hypothetical protein
LSHWTARDHQAAPTSESLSNATSPTFEFRAHGLLEIHSDQLFFVSDSKLNKVKGCSASATLSQFIMDSLVKTSEFEVLRHAQELRECGESF